MFEGFDGSLIDLSLFTMLCLRVMTQNLLLLLLESIPIHMFHKAIGLNYYDVSGIDEAVTMAQSITGKRHTTGMLKKLKWFTKCNMSLSAACL